MKDRLPYLMFFAALLLFLAMVWHYAGDAPERMAGHFNEVGKPTGKMLSSEFFGWMLGVGLSIPLILIAILFPIRFLSPKWMNTPYPDYWQKPENFRNACKVMLRSSFWFSAAFLVWTTGFMCLVVSANKVNPPRLDLSGLLVLTGLLIVVSTAWTIFLMRFFTRRPPEGEES